MSGGTKENFNFEGANLSHQTYMDKNFIVFAAITSDSYPEAVAQKFLSHLADNLYDADPYEFKKDPQAVSELDRSLTFNIYDLHSKYKNPSQITTEDSNLNKAQQKVNAVTSLMKQNLGSLMQNTEQLEDIES